KSGVLLKECLDATQHRAARVLYMATEGAHGIITRRLPLYCEQRGLEIADIEQRWWVLNSAPNLMNPAEVDEFCAYVKRVWGRVDLAPIDTITKGVGDAKLNQPEIGAAIAMGAERMAQALGGATVIGVTHPVKSTGKSAKAQKNAKAMA